MESAPSLTPSDLWLRLSLGFLSTRAGTKDYVKVIEEWCEYLETKIGSDESALRFLTATDIEAGGFVAHLKTRPGIPPRLRKSPNDERAIASQKRSLGKAQKGWRLSNSTLRKKITLIRSVYKYLVDSGVLTKNPFALIKLPRDDSGSKRPTEMIEFSYVMNLVNAPNTKTSRGLRDSAILAASFGGALRRSEAVKLRLSHVHKNGKGKYYLSLLNTKNKRSYNNHEIAPWAGEIVMRYKKFRESEGAKPDDYLFASTQKGKVGEPIDPATVYKMFRRYAKQIGLNTWASPHSARATSITKLLVDKRDLIQVRQFSRHKYISTVEVYDKRLKESQNSIGGELTFEDE